MKKDPKRVIAEIAEHTGYSLSEEELDSVEEYTRFYRFSREIWNKLAKARKTRTSPSTLGLKKFGLGKLWVKKVFLGQKHFLSQKRFSSQKKIG